MESTSSKSSSLLTKPSGSRIDLSSIDNELRVNVPSLINTGLGIITMVVIFLWLISVLIWTVLILSINPILALVAIPFWVIGILSLLKSRKILSTSQSLTVTKEFLEFSVKQGSKKESTSFPLAEINIKMVEGSYNSISGLNRRGIYPAIIYNDEAFGFAERSNTNEKRWLVQAINDFINK